MTTLEPVSDAPSDFYLSAKESSIDVAQASLGLRDASNLTASQPLPHNSIGRDNGLTLLSLPLDIRLLIYEYLVDDLDVLRTCKKVHDEARAFLYARATFYINDPDEFLRAQPDLKLVKKVEVQVRPVFDIDAWQKVLEMLLNVAGGLRQLRVWFLSMRYCSRPYRGRSLGDELQIVRALGKFQGLEELVIQGMYSVDWLPYLETKTGARVLGTIGHNEWVSGLWKEPDEWQSEYKNRETVWTDLEKFNLFQIGINKSILDEI